MITESLRRAFQDNPFTPQEAATVLGIQSPYSTLNRLKEAGVIERRGRGVYGFTPLDRPLKVGDRLEHEMILGLRKKRDAELPAIARRAWRLWRRSGYIEPLGPRHYRVAIRRKQGGAARVRRRG